MKIKRFLSILLCVALILCMPFAVSAQTDPDPDLGVDDNPWLPKISITAQPQEQNVVIGETAELSVQATSLKNETLSYQWYTAVEGEVAIVDGDIFSGAETATLAVNTAGTTWCQGGYPIVFCRISDGTNTLDSQAVYVKVSHSAGELIVDTEPTCKEKGTGHTECTVCGTTVETDIDIPVTNEHVPGDVIEDVKPTCKEKGTGHTECTVCGITIESDIEIAVSDKHTPGDVIEDVKPTCKEKGKGHTECTVCGTTVETDIDIPVTNEHVPGDVIEDVKPTCKEKGKGHTECTVCGTTVETDIDIPVTNEHVPGDVIEDVKPTCKEKGKGHTECTVCGITIESDIEIAISDKHTPGDVIEDVKPTCKEKGTGHKDCTVCGATVEEGIEIPTESHDSGEWVTTKKATATTDGLKELKCTKCGTVLDSKVIKKTGKNTLTVFNDLKKSDWYVKNGAIDFAYNQGLFSGTSTTTFGANDNMTRGMFVTVLGRLHGVKSTKATTKFTDVKKNAYYSGYVAWANKNGIVSGTSATTFGPEDNINREQICAMMVRYCNFAGIKLKKLNKAVTFNDARSISSFAKKAVAACQVGGIVGGEQAGSGYRFRPKGNATRAEVATIMMNFYKKYCAE